jgi:hypothetical protein
MARLLIAHGSGITSNAVSLWKHSAALLHAVSLPVFRVLLEGLTSRAMSSFVNTRNDDNLMVLDYLLVHALDDDARVSYNAQS